MVDEVVEVRYTLQLPTQRVAEGGDGHMRPHVCG